MDAGGLIVGGGGVTVLATAIQLFFNRRQRGADTELVVSKAATNLVGSLSDQIDRLERKVLALESRVDSLTDELDKAHDLNRHKDDLIAAMTREQNPQKEIP